MDIQTAKKNLGTHYTIDVPFVKSFSKLLEVLSSISIVERLGAKNSEKLEPVFQEIEEFRSREVGSRYGFDTAEEAQKTFIEEIKEFISQLNENEQDLSNKFKKNADIVDSVRLDSILPNAFMGYVTSLTLARELKGTLAEYNDFKEAIKNIEAHKIPVQLSELEEQNIKVYEDQLSLGTKIYGGWDLGTEGIHIFEYEITSVDVREKNKYNKDDITHTTLYHLSSPNDALKLEVLKEGIRPLFTGGSWTEEGYIGRSYIALAMTKEKLVEEIREYIKKKVENFELTLMASKVSASKPETPKP